MNEEVQPHYYMNIPAYVWNDEDLLEKPKAILLYGHISTLANQKGYCWATNEYFMKQLKTSKASIIRYINLLAKKRYIKRKIIYEKETRQVKQRLLSIDTRPGVIDDTRCSVTDDTRAGITDDTDNNININNTSNNNSSSTTSENNNAFEMYQINVGMLSGTQTPIFLDYVQKLSDEVVQYAIDLMLNQTARPNFKYLQKILMKYESLNIHSVDKVKQIEKQHQLKMKRKVQTRKPIKKKREYLF